MESHQYRCSRELRFGDPGAWDGIGQVEHGWDLPSNVRSGQLALSSRRYDNARKGPILEILGKKITLISRIDRFVRNLILLRIVWIVTVGLSMSVILGCDGEQEPGPTADIRATTDATVTAETPTNVSTVEPTAAPAPTVALTPDTPTPVPARSTNPIFPGLDSSSTGEDLIALLSADEAACLEARMGDSYQGFLGTPLMGDARDLLTGNSNASSPVESCLVGERLAAARVSMLSIAAGGFSVETRECIAELLETDPALAQALTQPGDVAGGHSALRLLSCLTPAEAANLTPPGEGPAPNPDEIRCLMDELAGTPAGERIIAVLSGTDPTGTDPTGKGLTMEESAALGVAVESCGIETEFGFPPPGDTENQGLPPDDLSPVELDDPQQFFDELSAGERSCLGDNGIGLRELGMLSDPPPGGSPETTAAIVNCLQDDTVLRLFLTQLVGQVEPFDAVTAACIQEGFVSLDLRALLAPAVAGQAPANSLALSMAALSVSVACLSDAEWETYAPRLGMAPGDRAGFVCLLEELGGPAELVAAMQDASLGETPTEFVRASQVCGLESPPPGAMSTPPLMPTPPTGAAAGPAAAPFPQQAHVILRVVLVSEDWVPFSLAGGWTEAAPEKESESLRYYEAAIWEETDSVRLYAFPNDYAPFFGVFGDVPASEVIAYREQYAISVHEDMPEESSDERSDFLRAVFEDFARMLVHRHPDAEHHLMFNGHGGPGGDLFEKQMKNRDADAFLATWTGRLGKPLGVVDMGGPCNKGGYEDLANFCKHARYYVASDLPNGGYSTDDWMPEKHWETSEAKQYHRILESNDTLEEALIERVNLRRKDYEYSRSNLTQDRWPQANYVYSCVAFRDFSAAFDIYLDETTIPDPLYDLYELMLEYSAPPSLLEKFQDVFVHAVDNRDFFTWNMPANGMITPFERIYSRWASSEASQR